MSAAALATHAQQQFDLFPGTREAVAFHAPAHRGFFSINWRNAETIVEANRIRNAQADLDDYLGHGDRLDLRRHLVLNEHSAKLSGASSVTERVEQLRASVAGKSPYPVRQQCLPIAMLPRALDALVSRPKFAETDWWISQNGFSQKNRRATNVLHLNMLFVDIDIREIGGPDHWLAKLSPEVAAGCLATWCSDNNIPLPSIIVWSGNGLHAKWFFSESVPRAAKPAWDALQAHLVAKLLDGKWPVDQQARDVSRILRVPGTYNQKGNELCRIVWESGSGPDSWSRYDFNSLVDGKTILPWTRAEARELRAIGKIWDENRKLARSSIIDVLTRPNVAVSQFLAAELWHNRLSAMRRLAEIRYGTGGVPEGQRNNFVWIAANALAWSAGGADKYFHDLLPVVQELAPSLAYSEILSSASSVSRRVKQKDGQDAGLYKMTNDRFRELLGITDGEAALLFSSGAGRQPNPEWNVGVMGFAPMANLPFAEYQAETRRRQAAAAVRTAAMVKGKTRMTKKDKLLPKVLALLVEGHSHRAIATELGVSHPTISSWIADYEKVPEVATDELLICHDSTLVILS